MRREKGFLVGGDKTTKPHFKANLNFIPDEKNRQYQRLHPLYTIAQSRAQEAKKKSLSIKKVKSGAFISKVFIEQMFFADSMILFRSNQPERVLN